MIVWGTFASQSSDRTAPTPLTWALWGLNALGVSLALSVFMADSLRSIHQGWEVTRLLLPSSFNWSAFLVALALMAAPMAQVGWGQTGVKPASDRGRTVV
jgi:hypothetical protein